MNTQQIQTNRFLIEHKRLLRAHLNKCAMEMNFTAYKQISEQITNDISLIDELIDYHCSCPALPEQGGASSFDEVKSKNLDLFDDDDLPEVMRGE